MAKNRVGVDGSIWKPLGGSSRRFENVQTGEVLSRRQFDVRQGLLARQGFRSFEKKAAATPPDIRATRPAIGRPSKRRETAQGIRSLNPLTEKQSREVIIPFVTFYDAGWFEAVDEYQGTYASVIGDIKSNHKISAVQYKMHIRGASGEDRFVTIMRLTRPHSLITFENFVERLDSVLYDEDETLQWIVHLQFYSKYIPTSKRKRDIAKSRQLKTVREAKRKRRKK